MKKHFSIVTLITVIFVIFISCASNTARETGQASKTDSHKFTVEEVLQTSSYTYLKINEEGENKWMAIPKADIKAGDTYYYQSALNMKDFKSRELDRTFESILFVQSISREDAPTQSAMHHAFANHEHKAAGEIKTDIKVEKAENGISLAELFENQKEYDGKKVKIRGQVVKFNSQIMGKNWVHLQDGSGEAKQHDLTITTLAEATVGDVVTFEGIITLNKDFGSGYSYAIIMEEALVLQ